MKLLAYRKREDENQLVYEEHYDDNKNVIYYKDYLAQPPLERKISYNERHLIIEEKEISEGEVLSIEKYYYDEKDRLIEKQMYIGNELYESGKTIYTEYGCTYILLQDGEQIQKNILVEDELKSELKIYEGKNLLHIEKRQLDEKNNINIIETFDTDDELVSKKLEYLNAEKIIIKEEYYNENEELTEILEYKYENGKLVEEKFTYSGEGLTGNEYCINWEFDEKGNIINMEVRDLSDKLKEFHMLTFDEKGRVVEESGLSLRHVRPTYNNNFSENHFHFFYEYK